MIRNELYDLLQTALKTSEQRRSSIKQFQTAVFDGDQKSLGLNEMEWDVLTQLAQDLDYWEPDPVMRREDATLYGDERLLDKLREALAKLHVRV